MLRVRLAGGLGLELDGREIPLPRSRRARALLAWLAVHPGSHPRSELAGRFWPDVLDESARVSLRAALSELRRSLGASADSLVATRDTVALEAWVDLREFAALVGAGRADEAVAACGGELLTGMDDEWVYELRREHEAQVSRIGAAAAAALVPVPDAVARAGAFVGRDAELGRLDAAWRGGGRRLVLVAGEPGVGKTRLALRFAAQAASEGALVLIGRCSEDPLAAFEPFTEVLRQVGPAAVAVSREVDRLLGAPRGGADDPGARHRLFAAVDDVLSELAAHRPLVLVLDDLHWADRPTLLLLGFILRSGRGAPLLVIGTYRDTDVGRRTPLVGALPDLRRDGGGDRIALRGLGRDEVGELARAVLGEEAAARVAGPVHTRTGGNAFFVEEVLRGLAEDDAAVPESVRHAVGARLGRLSADADELLAVAAVLGLVVDPELLTAVAGRAPLEVEPLLDELIDARLLRVAGATLEFPHALVREAVDADLNPLRRARLHRAAAEALIERGPGSHLEEIAHHLSEAADERAPEYLQLAGEHALELLAYEEAAAFFGRALEAAPSGQLELARGDALLRAGEPDAARECFERAARSSSDPELLGRAALGFAGLGVTIIDLDEAVIARLEEALAAVEEPVLRSELLARLAVELYYAPSRDRSEALSSEAVAVARASGDRGALAAALNARHVALWRPDRLAERLATADEMIEAGSGQLELQGRNWRVCDLFESMRIDEWRAEVRHHGELAARLQLPAYTWYTPLWSSVDAVLAGRWDEAAELREQAREAGRRAGDRNADLFAEMARFGAAILRHTWDDVDMTLLHDKVARSPAAMAWRCSYAWILAETGRVGEAREELAALTADDFAAIPFDANWPSAMGELAEVSTTLGDAVLAAHLYDRLLPYAAVALTSGRAIGTFGSTERLLAGLAATLGRPDEARARHERAIALNEAAGFTAWAELGRRAVHSLSRAGSSAVRAADS